MMIEEKKIFIHIKKMTARTNIFQGQRFSNGAFNSGGEEGINCRVYDFLGTGTSFLTSKKVSLLAVEFGSWKSQLVITNLVANDLLGYDLYNTNNIHSDTDDIDIVGTDYNSGNVVSIKNFFTPNFMNEKYFNMNLIIQSSHVLKRDGEVVPKNEYDDYLCFFVYGNASVSLDDYESNIGLVELYFTLKDSTQTLPDITAQIGGLDKSSMTIYYSNQNNKDISIGFVFGIIGIIILAYIFLSFLPRNPLK